MNKEDIPVITDREELYDKCENMEQLFDKYYLPLLDKHYSKTYKLQQENQELKKQLENKNKQIEYLRRGIERKEDTIIDLQNERIPYTNEYVAELENQQKEFIEYLNSYIELLNNKPYLLEEIEIVLLEEVLSKYKSIIRGKDENNSI